MYRLDLDIFRAIHIGWHQDWLDPVFCVFTYLGNGAVQTIAILLGLFTRVGRKAFWAFACCLLFGGLLGVQELKRLIPRDRPSNLPWAHPQEPLFQGSFPSGHTTSAFALAVMLFLVTRGTRLAWTGWTAIGLAVLVGISRIYRGVHWPSDVLAGAFYGTFFACAFYLLFERFQWRSSTSSSGQETESKPASADA